MEQDRTQRIWWLAACALWIGVWQVASLLVGSSILLAGPLDTLQALVRIIATPSTWPIVWFSLSRIATGFCAAFALGIVLAMLAHALPALRIALGPLVSAFKSIPVACVTVLLLMWVGSREVSGVAVFLMAFPALYLAMLQGVKQAHDDVHVMLRSFCVSAPRVFCAHTWQRALPYLVATSRNACGMAWKAGVAAELIGTPLGSMGERVYQVKVLLETADLFAWTILVVALSFVCERVFVGALELSGPAMLRLALVGGAREGEASTSEHHDLAENGHRMNPAPIALRDATIGYVDNPVATHINLALDAGGRLVLSNPSGTGKTTLLHTMAGLIPPLAGSVAVPPTYAMVFQEARLVEQLDAQDNVRLASMADVSRSQAHSLLMELLPQDALDKPVAELSGGQRRRVEIVRALAHPSAAVLMDEPFSSLDDSSHTQARAFVERRLAGRTLVVASHDPTDKVLAR